MKILFVAYMKEIMMHDANLLKRSHSVEIIDLFDIASSYNQAGKYLISYLKEIPPMIKESDMVFIWSADIQTFPIILLAKLLKKRVILHINGYEVCKEPSIGYGAQLNFLHGAITRWCIRNSDDVLVMSSSYSKMTKEIEPRANVHVVPGSIDTDLCKISLPKKENVVTTALMSYKNSNIIKGVWVFEKCSHQLPDAKFRIVKDASHDNLIRILMKSKVYCQLSYTESFGVTLLEAMACGCVPVITDRGAMPEIAGKCGIIVPYGDVNATTEAIDRALMMSGDLARSWAKYYNGENRLKLLNRIIERTN